MNDLIAITLGYSVVFFLTLFFFNFLSNGFLLMFILARAGRGKKALVEVYGIANIYYKIGKFDGETLIFKNSEGKKKRILVTKGSIHRLMNVPNVKVDDEKNSVLKVDFSATEGHDAVKTDNLLVRALTMPIIENQKEKMIAVFILIGLICAVAFLGFKVVAVEKLLLSLKASGVIG